MYKHAHLCDHAGQLILKHKAAEKNGCYWKTLSRGFENEFKTTASIDLEEGTSGIALFLLRLYGRTKNMDYLRAANQALAWCTNYCRDHPDINYGFHKGKMGVVYSLIIHSSIDNRSLISALQIAQGSLDFILSPVTENGFSYGRSGTLLILLMLYDKTKLKWILDYVDNCLEIMLQSISFTDKGIVWEKKVQDIQPLCGFQSGTSGVVFVLQQVAKYFNNPSYTYFAKQTLYYENAQWSRTHKGWPDYRRTIEDSKCLALHRKKYADDSNDFFLRPEFGESFDNGRLGNCFSRVSAVGVSGDLAYMQNVRSAIHSYVKLGPRRRISLLPIDLMAENWIAKMNRRDQLVRCTNAEVPPDHVVGQIGDCLKENLFGLKAGVAGWGYYLISERDSMFVFAPELKSKTRRWKSGYSKLSLEDSRARVVQCSYPKVFKYISILHPEIINLYFNIHNQHEVESDLFSRYVLTFSKKLNGIERQKLSELISFERRILKIKKSIQSGALLHISEIMNFENCDKLLRKNEKSFMTQILKLNDICILIKLRFNWPLGDMQVLSQKSLTPSDNYFILLPTSSDAQVQEIQISKLTYSILCTFKTNFSVQSVFDKYSGFFAKVPNKDVDLIKVGIVNQVRHFVSRNILLNGEQ